MLCEQIATWRHYAFGPVWEEVLNFVEQRSAGLTASTTIAGCAVHYHETRTKRLDSCLYESHRRMVDLQVVLEGEEYIYVAPSAGLALLDPFDEVNDNGLHVIPDREIARISLHPGMFALLFPWDAHLALLAPDNTPAPIRKLVVKLPLDRLQLR